MNELDPRVSGLFHIKYHSDQWNAMVCNSATGQCGRKSLESFSGGCVLFSKILIESQKEIQREWPIHILKNILNSYFEVAYRHFQNPTLPLALKILKLYTQLSISAD